MFLLFYTQSHGQLVGRLTMSACQEWTLKTVDIRCMNHRVQCVCVCVQVMTAASCLAWSGKSMKTVWLPGMCSFFFHKFFFLCVSLFFKKKKCDTYAAWQEAASTKRCVLGFFPAICLEKVKTKQNLSGCCYPFTLVNVICKSLSNVIFWGAGCTFWVKPDEIISSLSWAVAFLATLTHPPHPGAMSTLTT